MNTAVENEIIADLHSIADSDYQQFQAKLVPNLDANLVLGVRTPALRRYAKHSLKTLQKKHKYLFSNFLILTTRKTMFMVSLLDIWQKRPKKLSSYLIDSFLTLITGQRAI